MESADFAFEKVAGLNELSNGDRKCAKLSTGRAVLVVKHSDRYFAIDQACYHHGGPLIQGAIEDFDGKTCIVCPWHGYKITMESGEGLYRGLEPDATGTTMRQIVKSKGVKQRTHPVQTRPDGVYVADAGSPPTPPPGAAEAAASGIGQARAGEDLLGDSKGNDSPGKKSLRLCYEEDTSSSRATSNNSSSSTNPNNNSSMTNDSNTEGAASQLQPGDSDFRTRGLVQVGARTGGRGRGRGGARNLPGRWAKKTADDGAGTGAGGGGEGGDSNGGAESSSTFLESDQYAYSDRHLPPSLVVRRGEEGSVAGRGGGGGGGRGGAPRIHSKFIGGGRRQ